MAKTGITYEDFLKAHDALQQEGQKVTIRNLHAKTGGSPNTVTKHWQQYKKEQTALALGSIEEELSAQLKQAVLAEFARKAQGIKELLQIKIGESEQQLAEVQELLSNAEQENEALRTEMELAKKQSQEKIMVLEKKLSALEQKAADATLEIDKTEKRANDLQKELRELQKTQHQAEVRAAAAEARNAELTKQLEKVEQNSKKQ